MTQRALLLVCLFALAALAGCTARADDGTFPDDPTMLDAIEAYPLALAAITEIDPDAEFLGIRGSEGVLPEGTLRFWLPVADLEDDALDDGALGDGQLSSWLAAFRVNFGVMTVQVFADGRAPETHLADAIDPRGEDADEEEDGRTDASSWLVSSSKAAFVVADDADFAQHVADYPSGGYVYQYLPYSDRHPTYDWSDFFMFGGQGTPEPVGWSISGNSWLITHFDPLALQGNVVPTVAVANIDAATSKMTGFEAFVPRMPNTLYEGGTYDDPMVPESLDPYVHEDSFEIPVGTGSLSGYLIGFVSTIGVGVLPDEPIIILLAPDGTEAFRSSGTFGFEEIAIEDPQPGTWLVHITHERPIPQSNDVHGALWATVPVTEDTPMPF